MRHDVRNDGAGHRRQGSERYFPRPLIEWSFGSARPCPRTDGSSNRDTSRQSNTHNTESREVYYPWPAWFGLKVWIDQALEKNGDGVCRCRLDQNRSVRLLEVPEWMFDVAICSQMQIANMPEVCCEALRDLKKLTL